MISTIDQSILIYLNQLAQSNPFWHSWAVLSARYLIFLVVTVPFVVVARERQSDDQEHGRRELIRAAFSIVLATAIGFVIESAVGRARPSLTLPEEVRPLIAIPANSSFPSAHTWISFAFAASFMMCRRYTDVGRWLLTLAVLVGVGRIMAGLHYPSDIVAGALVGFSSAYVIVQKGQPLFYWLAHLSEKP